MESVNFIHVVQDKDQWQALVNTVMNFRVVWDSQGLCSMQLVS